MKSSTRKLAFALFSALASATPLAVHAQAPVQTAEQTDQGKFSYIVFYRNDDELTRTMAQVVKDAAAKEPDAVTSRFVQITNPADAAIVKQFNMGRAPMPLTLVAAPNGAVTGVFRKHVTHEQLAGAFVTTSMSHCMKAMQDGKLVFLALQTTPDVSVPQGVADFVNDPQFKERVAVVPVQAADQAEAKLLAELAIGTGPNQPTVAFFSPPGVVVGTFGAAATKAEIASALHAAGKCCDDPNCKHGKSSKSGQHVR
jgi:hypothetical protein